MHKDVKEILYTQEEIVEKCKELAKQMTNDYNDKEVILVGLLKGSVPFLAELSKYIELDVTFDYMDVSSYEGVESRTITIKKDLDQDVKGKDILLVEDILDTGKTLTTVKAMLEERGANSVEIVTMLDKKEGRTYPIEAKYVGFEIPNAFVIGFGLDFNEKYRQLPYVGILKEECYQ
ncbi:hypoxanthine phosphoribosyltransferase [Massilimicrobiota timonensis]|jgi:hypoxanthine phosphoribosyltransferase|uniref:Hypoxanthine phosphoribosyltransferase n=1 Tax=Massilimicrobiota timonensis TaxID=1776392 RepID=A0ABT7UKW6_9FIRM|nr:hypoxanthine phosphoribosyltransferase [Massilimicrobiota timonensis]MDM8196137.1 hypoxanthine phosphoribosyltransferase [Massilimicrobiota timonensis]MEE0779723.1 hypoxanthine phosphoribosyltransferase [Massilimicrobiota sp.]